MTDVDAHKERDEHGFIRGHAIDARFEHGPHDGQVRPVWLGAMMWYLREDGAIHLYAQKRAVWSRGVLVGLVFRYIRRER